MERYNVIREKNPREIVLLKGFPCIWGNVLSVIIQMTIPGMRMKCWP